MKGFQCAAMLCMAAVVLCGCTSGGSGGSTEENAAGLDVISQASVAQLRPTTLEFTTAQTVAGSDFGLVGDGVTLNTEAFKRALGSGDRTVLIAAGDYLTSGFNIPGNTILVLAPGVTIRDSGTLGQNDRLINIRSENVHIKGLGARIIADRSRYISGEQRHGVYIFGAHNVAIEGLESSGHGGDGFYIGGPPGNPASDVAITGCSADTNRRQGLSITSAIRVFIADCELTSTRGTAPEFGIDLEPNAPVDQLREITIVRPSTVGNSGGGILIALERLDITSQPATITIIDHTSMRERVVRRSTGVRGTVDLVRYAVSR